MSTRGLIGYHLRGKDYLQYNHSDSYPMGLGRKMVAYARTMDVEQTRERVAKLVLVDEDKRPTETQLKKVYPFVKEGDESFEQMRERIRNLSVAEANAISWYKVLREFQGDLAAWDAGLPFWPDYDGFQWSGACEWAYVVNLDCEALEIYTGHWNPVGGVKHYYTPRKPVGRFALHPEDGEPGILLVATLPLAELRSSTEGAVERFCERLEKRY